jgi:hypothetical protein
MAEAVYVLCALTSVACSLLLTRAYRRSRVRLLFWSALCFAALALSNVLVFVDLVVIPQTDLGPVRGLLSLVGLATLLFGLIWEAR